MTSNQVKILRILLLITILCGGVLLNRQGGITTSESPPTQVARRASDVNTKFEVSDAAKTIHIDSDKRRDMLMREFVAAASVKDIFERAKQTSDIISRLCDMGYISEAFGLIEPSLGHARTSQLEAFFSSNAITLSQAGEYISQLTLKLDGLTATSAFFVSRANGADFDAYINSPEIKRLLPLIQADLPPHIPAANRLRSRFLTEKANQAKSSADAQVFIGMARDALANGGLDPDSYLGIVKAAKMEAGEKWNALSEGFSTPCEIDTKLVDKMLASDGKAAMELFCAKSDSRHLAALEHAVIAWSTLDDDAAQQWFNSTKSGLNPQQRDSVAKAFSEWAFELSEIDAATQWANTISDGAVKQSILDKIKK